MIEIKGKKFDILDDSLMFDENEMAEYITVFYEGIPTWYKVTNNSKGAYIKINGERYYILVNTNSDLE